MSKPKVLLVNEFPAVEKAYLDSLKESWDITQAIAEPDALAKQFLELVEQNGPFTAVGYFFGINPTKWFTLDEASLAPLVDSGCKLITVFGSGHEQVDVPYLTKNKVIYANNPQAPKLRTADTTTSMILSALRGSWIQDKSLRQGKWLSKRTPILDARGRTLGIIGMGAIGQIVASQMAFMGMKIIYTKRNRLPESEEQGYQYVSLDELLAQADVISVHCPLTPETRRLVGKEEFNKMKDGVILVNTSRGAILDEGALVDALRSGKVMRAALDVYENEPKVHPGLLELENTLLCPHVAAFNDTFFRDQQMEILKNIEAFINTGKPNTPVNDL